MVGGLQRHQTFDEVLVEVEAVTAFFVKFIVITPHVRMIVVELSEEIMQLRRIFRLERPHHPRLKKVRESLRLFYRRQQPKAPAELILRHASSFYTVTRTCGPTRSE
jgi:hypothetical protein